jgi:hypothetical protein
MPGEATCNTHIGHDQHNVHQTIIIIIASSTPEQTHYTMFSVTYVKSPNRESLTTVREHRLKDSEMLLSARTTVGAGLNSAADVASSLIINIVQ